MYIFEYFLMFVSASVLTTSYVKKTEKLQVSNKVLINKPIYNNNRHIEPEFASYVSEFEKMFGEKVGFDITFAGELPNRWIGECQYFSDGNRKIFILKPWWVEASDGRRRALLFHELGHCLFDRMDHSIALYSDSCPKSLMYPSAPNEWCLKKYWNSYMQELPKNRHN